jgi:hypothetical protein
MNNPFSMGVHEQKRESKTVWTRQGLVVTSTDELLEIKFAPHFKSWPKLVRRLEIQGSSCEVKLVGKTLSVITTAELQHIQTLLGNRRLIKKPKLRFILLAPGLVVLGALSFALQPQNYSTQLRVESIPNDECGIEYLSKAIISDSPNPNLLEKTSSNLGGIESGTFFCAEAKFGYTLELKEPKRLIRMLKLDP